VAREAGLRMGVVGVSTLVEVDGYRVRDEIIGYRNLPGRVC
jgi:hypothetical protein